MTKMCTLTLAGLLGLGMLSGCQHERHESIPASAQNVAESRDGDVRFTAPNNGEVYVYDVNKDELVYSGKIHKGETLELQREQDEDQIRLDSQVVSTGDLKEGNKYRIFYKPSEKSEAGMASDSSGAQGNVVREEKTTVIQQAPPAQPADSQKTVTEIQTHTTPSGNVIVEEKKTTTETKP